MYEKNALSSNAFATCWCNDMPREIVGMYSTWGDEAFSRSRRRVEQNRRWPPEGRRMTGQVGRDTSRATPSSRIDSTCLARFCSSGRLRCWPSVRWIRGRSPHLTCWSCNTTHEQWSARAVEGSGRTVNATDCETEPDALADGGSSSYAGLLTASLELCVMEVGVCVWWKVQMSRSRRTDASCWHRAGVGRLASMRPDSDKWLAEPLASANARRVAGLAVARGKGGNSPTAMRIECGRDASGAHCRRLGQPRPLRCTAFRHAHDSTLPMRLPTRHMGTW
jgi:hypothetical protein